MGVLSERVRATITAPVAVVKAEKYSSIAVAVALIALGFAIAALLRSK